MFKFNLVEARLAIRLSALISYHSLDLMVYCKVGPCLLHLHMMMPAVKHQDTLQFLAVALTN